MIANLDCSDFLAMAAGPLSSAVRPFGVNPMMAQAVAGAAAKWATGRVAQEDLIKGAVEGMAGALILQQF